MAALSRPAVKYHQEDGKGGQHTELRVRNSSRLTDPALKRAEKHFGFAHTTKMTRAEPGALTCLQTVGHTHSLSPRNSFSHPHIKEKKMKIK